MTYYYVDPVSGSNSADGLSDANAWQTLQHALTEITQATYGDQINLKSSGPNVLTGSVDWSDYAPTASGHLVVRGYESVADDGGLGVIDGDATYQIEALSNTSLVDLEIRNLITTTDGIASVGNYSRLINCYIHSLDRDAIGNVAGRTNIIGCRFENISRTAARAMAGFMYGCYFSNGSNYAFTTAVNISAQGHLCNSIFNLGGASNGVNCSSLSSVVQNCTFYGGGGGSGTAYSSNSTDAQGASFAANIISGFTSGVGVDIQSDDGLAFFDNTFHDCGTAIINPATAGADGYGFHTGNETITEDPFAKSGTNDYSNRMVFFAPEDVGNVLSGSVPRGAVPSGVTTASGYSLHPLAYN